MGKKAAYRKQFKRRGGQAPRLPPEIKKALEEHGVEIPRGVNGKQFYSKLGIRSDPNADVRADLGFTDRLGEIKKQQRVKQPGVTGDPEAFATAAETVKGGPKYQRRLNDFEMRCVMQLRAFYGDDYEKMALDYKRNPLQWSVGQIKRSMQYYEREAEALAAEAEMCDE